MITEIVSFDLPNDLSRDAVIALFEKSVPRWQGWPHSRHKRTRCS